MTKTTRGDSTRDARDLAGFSEGRKGFSAGARVQEELWRSRSSSKRAARMRSSNNASACSRLAKEAMNAGFSVALVVGPGVEGGESGGGMMGGNEEGDGCEGPGAVGDPDWKGRPEPEEVDRGSTSLK